MVVMDDADLDLAVEGALFAGFGTAGQRCTSLGTAIVHDSTCTTSSCAGSTSGCAPRRSATRWPDVLYGPMLHERFAERFEDWLGADPAAPHGARLERGRPDHRRRAARGLRRRPRGGRLLPPDVRDRRDGATTSSTRTETFGPLVGVARFETFDEAIELANGHGYGLSSAIYTTSPDARVPLPRADQRGHGVDQQLDVGRRGAPPVRRQRQVRQRLAPVGHLGARPVHPLAVDELGLRRASCRRRRWTSSRSRPRRTSGWRSGRSSPSSRCPGAVNGGHRGGARTPVNAGRRSFRHVLPALTAICAVNAGSAARKPRLPALTGGPGPSSMPQFKPPGLAAPAGRVGAVALDFTLPPELRDLLDRVRAYVEEDVLPAEAEIADPRGRARELARRRAPARPRARARHLHAAPARGVGRPRGSASLGMALISQECGVSGLASLGLNAMAPDEGNMHTLLIAGNDEQLETLPAPARRGPHPLVLRDDRARRRQLGPDEPRDDRRARRRRLGAQRAQVVHHRRRRRGVRDRRREDRHRRGRRPPQLLAHPRPDRHARLARSCATPSGWARTRPAGIRRSSSRTCACRSATCSATRARAS